MPSIYTQTVHAGERRPYPAAQPVATPVFHSVGYLSGSAEAMDAVFSGQQPGYVYQRYGNPTVSAFEAALSTLEGGEAAYATASGMAAVHGALLAAGVRSGRHIVAAQDVYGATYSLLDTLMREQGVQVHFVDPTDLKAVAGLAQAQRPAALLCETISNPLLKVADLAALAGIAHDAGAALIVDNTFASPYLCNPLSLGADFVVHSATKYISGHADVLAGVVITSAAKRERLDSIEKLIGAVLAPEAAWLALRGLKTLALRLERQCSNAARIAGWLAEHPAIARVNYPGLSSHAQHALAGRQFGGRGYGGMISFDLQNATRAAAFRFLDTLKLVLPATTLGDVYSLSLYPAMSSHRAVPPAERLKLGIGDGLIRLSAGIEDVEDLKADLDHALKTAA